MDNHQKFIMDELKIVQAQNARNAEQAAALERTEAEKWREQVNQENMKLAGLSREMDDIKTASDKESRCTCAIYSIKVVILTLIVDSLIQRILDWLDPPPFAATFENSREQREEGTSEWIFTDPAFIEWKASKPVFENDIKWKKMPPWVLWVHG